MGLSRWKVIVCLVLAAAAVWGFSHWRYSAGYGDADQHWREKWAQRDARDATALAQRQAEARQKNNADKVKLMRSENKPVSSLLACRLLPIVPVLFLVGCTPKPTNSPEDWQTVNVPAVPELPAEARQKPAVPHCLPTCLSGLTSERGNWQEKLMKQEPED